MAGFIIITALLILFGVMLVTAIERQAVRLLGQPLSFARRWLIPMPVFGLLAFNWLEIENYRAWTDANPRMVGNIPLRYNEYRAWDTDWIGITFLLLIVVLPFLVVGWSKKGWFLLPRVWVGHFVFLFVYGLHLLSTGVPLQD